MRVLTFTTLYPNGCQPTHGIFVENRLRHLLGSGEVSARVMAPVPWFPFANQAFGRYAAFAGVAPQEERHGVGVYHPRYPVLPKIGMTVGPVALYLAVRRRARKLIEGWGGVDLIDAHYFYPDGVAAVMLGRELGIPVVVTARGTDLNLIPDFRLPRRQIQWAARHAAGLVTVCQALKEALVALGVDGQRVRVLRNGVDLVQFRPLDHEAMRRRLGVTGQVILSVGGLIPRKGHHLVIEALPDLPDATLLIAGSGPERTALERLASRIGVADRVRFLGMVPHEELAGVYSAADVLVLASSREGWANVLLEAMACGTPVVATDVWGTAEVVADPAAGQLVRERNATAIGAAARQVLEAPPSRTATRAYAEGFDWEQTTRGQIDLFRDVLGASDRQGAGPKRCHGLIRRALREMEGAPEANRH